MMNLHARQFEGGISQVLRDEVNPDRGDEHSATGGAGDEDKGAAEAEAKAAEEKASKDAADKAAREKEERERDIKIPKVEFDRRLKAEAERTAAAEARAKKAEEVAAQRAEAANVEKLTAELEKLDEELDKALADNNAAEKARLRKLIREKNDAITDARVEARSAYATALAVEQVRYDGAVDRMEAEYPFLAPGTDAEPNPDYNAAIVKELVELKAAYEATGMASSAALIKATKTLAPSLKEAKAALKKDDKGGEKDAEKEAEKKAAEAKAKIDAETTEAKRKAEAVEKGLKAAEQQPKVKGDVGSGDKKVKGDLKGVGKLSDRDFDKLDEDTLKAARGDIVA